MSMPLPDERRLYGIGLRICSTTAFAAMAALLKAASLRGAVVPEMVFWRSCFALTVVSLWITIRPGWSVIRPRRFSLHVTRAAIGFVSMLLTFGALALLPLGEAATLTYAAPLISTLLSALLLKEQVGPHRWFAVAIGFAGVVLVTQPGEQTLPALGLAVGIAAAFGQAAVGLTLRRVAQTEHVEGIAFWFAFLSTLVTACGLPFFARAHPWEVYGLMAAAGSIGGVGQLAMTASLRHAPVSVVVPFDYLQIVLATLAGWLLFQSPLLASTIGGAALIAGSGLYTAYRERMHGRTPAQALAPPES